VDKVGAEVGFRSVLSCAQQWAAERIKPGDIAIDATVGNGVDTLFLCQTTGPAGTVYGFDVQEQAIEQANKRIRAQGGDRAAQPELFLRSHSDMLEALPSTIIGRVSAIMFNLGYLPGASSETVSSAPASLVITRPETTLPALEAALQLLKPDGIVTIVLYSGHEGGSLEAETVQSWAQKLPQEQYQVICYRFLNARAEAPYVIAVLKKKLQHTQLRKKERIYSI
jgi:predicted methyltransferase